MTWDLFLLAGQFPGTSHGEALRNAVDYGIAAERAGFTGVWIAEHHFIPYGVCPSAISYSAFLLGRTNTLRVGTAACVLSNRHPVALAEEAVLLHEFSGGRFDLGVARGGPWVDLEVFGTGLDRFTNGFAESVDLLGRWLSGAARVGADGERFRFRAVDVIPRPPRQLPVWIAATSGETVDLAAAHGLPLLLGVHASSSEHRALLDRYAHTAARHGHNPSAAPHASVHLVHVAATEERARRDLRAAMPEWIATTDRYVRLAASGPGRDPVAYVEHLLSLHPTGPATLCRQQLAQAAAVTGVRRQLLLVEATGCRRRTLDTIEALGAVGPLPSLSTAQLS
ncbi:LLM class flavin-dependent oxidoreductase [Pilimelia terevasa]|uniref:LLM class flavin-dependent oxidoreductase n=1 Tax=Pilimelia terevasa TaxID=53372 RepID=UPI001667CD9E|nr:LLM class flavin-dependent oxidoreductase [Pilimelia terevasa]